MVFTFPLPTPCEKRLCHLQMLAIVVAIFMLEVAVVAVTIVGLSTLASFDALSLDLTITLLLVPTPMVIYPPLPTTYIFDLNIDRVPGLKIHQSLDNPLFTPLLGFSYGLVFPPVASIIPDRERV